MKALAIVAFLFLAGCASPRMSSPALFEPSSGRRALFVNLSGQRVEVLWALDCLAVSEAHDHGAAFWMGPDVIGLSIYVGDTEYEIQPPELEMPIPGDPVAAFVIGSDGPVRVMYEEAKRISIEAEKANRTEEKKGSPTRRYRQPR